MLEDNGRKGKVEVAGRDYFEVASAVLIDVGVRERGESRSGLDDHFGTDVDGVDLAEQASQCSRNPSGATADFEHAHGLRSFALTDIRHVRQNFFGDRTLARLEKLIVGPVLFGRIHVETGVFASAGVPFGTHFREDIVSHQKFIVTRPRTALSFVYWS